LGQKTVPLLARTTGRAIDPSEEFELVQRCPTSIRLKKLCVIGRSIIIVAISNLYLSLLKTAGVVGFYGLDGEADK